jgi:hypothetical protein
VSVRTLTVKTDENRDKFLDALRQGLSISGACIRGGLSRPKAYAWRKEDPEFARLWEEAIEEGTDRIEDEALRRAVDGTKKPVFNRGMLVGHVQEYSDVLTIFLLKARRPEKFKDRSSHELTGQGGGPIRQEISQVREEFTGRITGIAARIAATGGDGKPH